jgi:hypothetical protein
MRLRLADPEGWPLPTAWLIAREQHVAVELNRTVGQR